MPPATSGRRGPPPPGASHLHRSGGRGPTALLDEDGYLAYATEQEDGSWLIVEHNCAILTVAHGFSQACSSELSFIS